MNKTQGASDAGDGWEPGPNPVAQVVGTRALQVGGVAALALAGVRLGGLAPHLLPVAGWGGLLTTGALSAYFVATFHAQTFIPGAPMQTRLPISVGNAVALTFDDGPHPDTTPRLLDILACNDARATFFLVGVRASAYPQLARRIVEEGHTVGVHGLRHRTLVLQSASAIRRDLTEAARRIEDATGQPLAARLFRPPYGFRSWTSARTAQGAGWRHIGWSLDARDYAARSADALAARITARLAARDIVLLHERPGYTETTNALPAILQVCRERGLRCVGVE